METITCNPFLDLAGALHLLEKLVEWKQLYRTFPHRLNQISSLAGEIS